MLRKSCLLAGSLAALVLVPAVAEAKPRFDARITRTTYGIPHIEARDWRGVGYGVAYAYAEDNLCLLAEEFATVAGERSLHFGPEAKATLGFEQVDNLSSDVFFRAVIDLPALRDGAKGMSARAQDLMAGYVAGYNRFLRDAGADGIPAECRGKAWVRPITADDMLRLNEKQMLLASSLNLAPAIANAAPPGSAAPKVSINLPNPRELGMGSNGWAFGGDVTAGGRGMVIGNPHFPWKGPNRFWQMHVKGPKGYEVMGVGLAGTPMPTLGFNKDIAWTHTVTEARHFTLYQLALDPADPTRYMVDGKSEAMNAQTVTVPMPQGTPAVTRTLWSTRFGPVFIVPGRGIAWTRQSAFALKDANRGNQRGVDTWLRIGEARNVGEVKAAVTETLGIPWVNTIAADRHGDALHADVTAVPNVSAAKAKTCATPIAGLFAEFAILLDGSKSSCDWDVAEGTPVPGLMPAKDQAATTVKTWLTNSNDSYWISNPAMPHRELSPILGEYGTARTLRTRSNFTETAATLAAGKMDHERAKAMAFANKSLAADLAMPELLTLCAKAEGAAARGCAALAKWDRRFEADSRGARLFRAFWPQAERIKGLWAVPFDAAQPVTTPRDLATEGETGAKLLEALAATVSAMEQAGQALDARWGDEQLVMAGNAAIPIHGGPGGLGILNMQESDREPNGKLVPRHGTSYIQIVTFDDTGPVADAILSYSQSTDPASPHAADQTRAYAAKQWHRLPFGAKAIRAQTIAKPKRIRE
ncbi:MAG: penicillin acylase family protein [Erythrobacter sp.]|jgi:acyl-homoserine-lactone acylase|uniref:penicillin acylase family protein n=1 Tax=Erythrobacter sp. TaxID=1042 RepID=UPI002B4AA500|nr:penicillin acylase family protein [Erythrobacter sp.]WRH70057.1 MAG: penicillin acylase family protein [Erythrobacter sp.]